MIVRLTCLLTILSTVERFSGVEVEFSISLLSCPVYTTRPEIYEGSNINLGPLHILTAITQ